MEVLGRSTVDGLRTPYPLASLLPGFLQEDEFAVRFTAGLDDVVAPVISAVDCLDAYVDPRLAPQDFLEWLAAWVGAPLDDNWTDEQRRASVGGAAELHRLRGTVEGVRRVVVLATGGNVEIGGSGGVTWALSPTDDQPQDATGLVIRVTVDRPDELRLAALDELVELTKPAHLPHRIEVEQR
jgi:phage tail-like protein